MRPASRRISAIFRRLVGLIDAGEILDLAGKRALVEALGVARDAFIERGIDENLDELALRQQLAHHAPLGAERRDERAQHDEAGVGHQLGDFADAADVLDAVALGEAQVAVETVADIVAVEQQRMRTARVQAGFDQIGDGRFAGARQAGEPQHHRLVMHQPAALGLADGDGLAMDIGRAPQREIDHAGGDRLVGIAVDQDEGAGVAVVGVRIEGDRPRHRQIADADLVQRQRLGGKLGERVDVDLVLEAGHGRRQRRVVDLHQIRALRQQPVGRHPDQMRGELIGHLRALARCRQHVAAGDVDFVGERDGDGIASFGPHRPRLARR